MQLICTAATETREFSVFGCRAVNLLLKYKWYGFAKKAFTTELVYFLINWVMHIVFIVMVTELVVMTMTL